LAEYATLRRVEKRSKNSKPMDSLATINRELRTVRAALNIAHE
jgi:hypothetical protein